MYDPVVCGRLAPMKERSEIGKFSAHGRRAGSYDYSHCSESRRSLVIAGVDARYADLIPDAFDALRATDVVTEAVDAHHWGGASIATELVLQVSQGALHWAGEFGMHVPLRSEALAEPEQDRRAEARAERADQPPPPWLVQFGPDAHDQADKKGELAQLTPASQRLLLTADTFVAKWNEARDGLRDEELVRFDRFDPRRVHDWVVTNLEGLAAMPNCHVACWRLDADETTPHIHAVLLPTAFHHGKSYASHRTLFNGMGGKHQLQNYLGQVNAPLGIRRGELREVTQSSHVAPKLYKKIEDKKAELASAEQALAARQSELDVLAAEIAAARLRIEEAEQAKRTREAEAAEQRVGQAEWLAEEAIERAEIAERQAAELMREADAANAQAEAMMREAEDRRKQADASLKREAHRTQRVDAYAFDVHALARSVLEGAEPARPILLADEETPEDAAIILTKIAEASGRMQRHLRRPLQATPDPELEAYLEERWTGRMAVGPP